MSRWSSLVLVTCGLTAAPACAEPDDPPPEGPGWESATTTTDDGSIVIQKVAYRSGGLRVFGQVCRPAGPGPFPLVVASHDGFAGLPAWDGGRCADAARRGVIQIEPAFRGQDGSEGSVEMCLGEVDDALHMLELALAMPEVDRSRVAIWGEGHGGCVALRAVQRGAPVGAAVTVSAISSLPAAYRFWRIRHATGVGPIVQYAMLMAIADAGIGGPPEDFPDAYQGRSPLELDAELPAAVPLLVAHTVGDPLVPPGQSCELAQRLDVAGHHFDAQHQLVAAAPAGCENAWTPSAAPIASWDAARYLVVYDAPGDAIDADVRSFLGAKLR